MAKLVIAFKKQHKLIFFFFFVVSKWDAYTQGLCLIINEKKKKKTINVKTLTVSVSGCLRFNSVTMFLQIASKVCAPVSFKFLNKSDRKKRFVHFLNLIMVKKNNR